MSEKKLVFQFEKKIGERSLLASGEIQFTGEDCIHVIMGSSGAGKTSLARWIAGLDDSVKGYLEWDNDVWFKGLSITPPQARRIGFLSQGDTLFPHLSVAENIAFGLRRWEKSRKEKRLAELLALIGMTDKAHQKPKTLSGGEKRRVALAQVLAVQPRLLILDEPFTGLDVGTKKILWAETRSWIKKFSLPTLLITHDEAEAEHFATAIHRYQGDVLAIKA